MLILSAKDDMKIYFSVGYVLGKDLQSTVLPAGPREMNRTPRNDSLVEKPLQAATGYCSLAGTSENVIDRSQEESTNVMRSSPMSSGLPAFTPQRSPNCAAVRNPGNYYLPKDVSSRFGMRLRQLRQERNLTQLRMSVDFGIDRTFISDVERGRKSISLPMLEVLALGLNMTLSELFRDL